MNYIYPNIPIIATLIAALIAFLILEKIYKSKLLPVSFDFAKTEVLLSTILYLILFTFVLLIFWLKGMQNATAGNTGEEYSLLTALQQLLSNAIILLPFGITVAIRKQSPRTLGLSKENLLPSIVGGLVISALVAISLSPFQCF